MVNTGAVFDFIVKNNILLIEILVGVILLAIVTLAYRNFFAKAKSELDGHADGTSISAIEASLKKILESTEVKSSAPAVSNSEVEGLKNSLLDKDRMIEELQFQLKAASEANMGESASSADLLQAQNRSKELEAKLAEYEIISEDIADLSMYKDENVKLKKELETLKKGAAASPAAAAPVLEEPLIPHVAVAPAAAVAPPAAEASADASAEFGGIDDDIMAEFARAVEEQKAAAAPAAPSVAAKEAAPVAPVVEIPEIEEPLIEVVAEAALPELEPEVAAEPVVAAEAVEEAEAEAPTVDLGEMNLEAMVAEADDLASKEVAELDQNILEIGLDTEKLAEEALTFQKVKNEDEQLMNQFEDFMKKGAS